jgi:hypothetical protein
MADAVMGTAEPSPSLPAIPSRWLCIAGILASIASPRSCPFRAHFVPIAGAFRRTGSAGTGQASAQLLFVGGS